MSESSKGWSWFTLTVATVLPRRHTPRQRHTHLQIEPLPKGSLDRPPLKFYLCCLPFNNLLSPLRMRFEKFPHQIRR
jgi:hypothetical protein